MRGEGGLGSAVAKDLISNGHCEVLVVAGQLATGGAERELVTFLEGARHQPIRVSVVSLSSGGVFRRAVEDLTGRRVLSPPSLNRFARVIWTRKQVCRVRPKLVHCWNLFPLFYLGVGFLRRPCPFVGFVQQVPAQAIAEGIHPWLYRWLCSVPDALVSNSQTALTDHEKIGISPTFQRTIHNGVSEGFFSSETGDDAIRLKGEVPIVVAVGRLIERKRFDWMIRAFSDLKSRDIPAHLWIVGDGPEMDRLKNMAEKTGVSQMVRFWGERQDVEKILPAADVFLHCAWAEGLPNTVQEAMAAGLPVVAPNTSGIPEVVCDGSDGRLFPVDDYEACRDSLIQLIEDEGLRRKMAMSARATAERNFKPEVMAQKMFEFYCDVIGRWTEKKKQ